VLRSAALHGYSWPGDRLPGLSLPAPHARTNPRQEEGEAPFIDTGVLQRGRGEPLKPVRYWFRQAEEAILWLEAEKVMHNPWAA
jgi:hypothetical protein